MVRTPTAANTEATKQKHNCWVRTPKPAKTEATKQRQHTTHDYSIYSSVAISVHCCLHWCSHRHLASVLAPYIDPAILHRCSHLAFFLCAFQMIAFVQVPLFEPSPFSWCGECAAASPCRVQESPKTRRR